MMVVVVVVTTVMMMMTHPCSLSRQPTNQPAVGPAHGIRQGPKRNRTGA
jgi:hypothetical protein